MLTHSYTVTHYSSRRSRRAPDNLIHFKIERGRTLTGRLTFGGVRMGTGGEKYYYYYFFGKKKFFPSPPPKGVLMEPLATGIYIYIYIYIYISLLVILSVYLISGIQLVKFHLSNFW